MPELPEAETIARGLAARIVDRRITSLQLNRTDIVREGAPGMKKSLVGRTIQCVRRRGKRVVVELLPGGRLIFALGMSGRLTVTSATTPIEKHTHLVLRLNEAADEIRFRDPRRFGCVWFYDGHPTESECAPLILGLEPTTMSLTDFRAVLDRRRQIKALLMDQHAVAGLGNIYCDESLHRARVHPLAQADKLSDEKVRNLHRSIQTVLRQAIRAGGSTIDDYRNASGDQGFFQICHRVYGREGRPCRSCGRDIIRIQAAGRSTHLCPFCQKK